MCPAAVIVCSIHTSVQAVILLCFLPDSSLMSSPKSSSLFENQSFPVKAAVSKLFCFTENRKSGESEDKPSAPQHSMSPPAGASDPGVNGRFQSLYEKRIKQIAVSYSTNCILRELLFVLELRLPLVEVEVCLWEQGDKQVFSLVPVTKM